THPPNTDRIRLVARNVQSKNNISMARPLALLILNQSNDPRAAALFLFRTFFRCEEWIVVKQILIKIVFRKTRLLDYRVDVCGDFSVGIRHWLYRSELIMPVGSGLHPSP